MIDRVVVPFDGSAVSRRALATARLLAKRAGAELELITIGAEADRRRLEPRLVKAASEVGGSWRYVATARDPEKVLVTTLRAGAMEVWCLGSHARGVIGELVAGSISEDLVREAHAPVVLVGPHAGSPAAGRVLAVALDGTDVAEAIVPSAANLAAALGMSLRLLQVAGPGSELLSPDTKETGYLSRTAAKTPCFELEDVDYDVLHGHAPAHDLAEYVAAHGDVGIVAAATHGRRGAARLMHPSTAFELARRLTVPVLLMHPDGDG